MKHAAVVFLATAYLAGCGTPAPEPIVPAITLAGGQVNGIRLELEIPKTTYAPMEEFRITITATNVTDKPKTIVAASGSPYFIYIEFFDGVCWQTATTYPQASTQVLTPWTLAPGESKTFRPGLIVEPTWPVNRLLRMRVQLNGLAEPSPALTLEVKDNTAEIKQAQ